MVDVGHFWGFQADEASLEKQRHLTAEINKRTLHPVTVSLYPNLLCLAPYIEMNDQSLYYRAKILHMRGNSVEVNMDSLTAVTGQDVMQFFNFLLTSLFNLSPV